MRVSLEPVQNSTERHIVGNPALQLKSATNAAWSRVLESASRTEVKQLLNEPLAELDSVWKEGKPFVRTVRRRVWLELLHRSDVVRQTVLHCHFTVVCAMSLAHTLQDPVHRTEKQIVDMPCLVFDKNKDNRIPLFRRTRE